MNRIEAPRTGSGGFPDLWPSANAAEHDLRKATAAFPHNGAGAAVNRIARAIYFAVTGRRLLVVRAFVKKTEKTLRREIELAERRMKELDHGQ